MTREEAIEKVRLFAHIVNSFEKTFAEDWEEVDRLMKEFNITNDELFGK